MTCFKKIRGGVAATAFDVVSDKLKKFGSVEYHKELRWRLNRKNKIYGFSCGFTRRELELFLPMPDIPHHDNFITLMAAFRGKLSFTSEHLALYRYTGVHNVTSIPYDFPFLVRNYYRAKMVTIAYMRYLKGLIKDTLR